MTNNNWIFESGTQIRFDNNQITLNNAVTYSAPWSNGTVSDSNGEPLFYTNGSRVYDPSHQLVGIATPNGYSQNMAIAELPYSCNSYYIFTVDRFPNWGLLQKHEPANFYPYHNEPEFSRNKLHVGQYNSSLNNVVDIAEFESPLNYRFTEKILTIPKALNNEFWIVTFMRKFNPTLSTDDDSQGQLLGEDLEYAIMRVFSLNQSGISFSHDVEVGFPVNPWGQVNVSLQNNRISICNWKFQKTIILELQDLGTLDIFDRKEIEIFGPDELPTNTYDLNQVEFNHHSIHNGCAFSPDGNFLYVSIVFDRGVMPNLDTDSGNYNFNYLYQINVSDETSRKVGEYEQVVQGYYGLGQIQNQQDELYLSFPGQAKLGKINNPNNLFDVNSTTSPSVSIITTPSILSHGLPVRINT